MAEATTSIVLPLPASTPKAVRRGLALLWTRNDERQRCLYTHRNIHPLVASTTDGARCVEHMATDFALSPEEIAEAAGVLLASLDTPSTKRLRRPR